MYTFLGSPRLRPERPLPENPEARQPPQAAIVPFPSKSTARSLDADREEIRASGVLRLVIQYGMGEIDLEAGRVTVLLSLLKKIVPDLSPVALPVETSDDEDDGSGASPNIFEFHVVDPKA